MSEKSDVGPSRARWRRRITILVMALLMIPLLGRATYLFAANWPDGWPHWSSSRWDSAALAPDPATEKGAVVQVYAARAYGWRGIFGVHSWIAVKAEGASHYDRYEVVGWQVRRGGDAIRARMTDRPDGYWAGNAPTLLREVRGAEAAAMIPKIEAAIESYPYRDRYLVWPGPNSNTFVAWIGRQVPEIGMSLPPTAIGKDFIVGGWPVHRMPSGTGVQLSLFGLLGVGVAAEEGIEVNLLGLVLGLDLWRPALKFPGIGRVGIAEEPAG